MLSASIAAVASADPGYPWTDTLPADEQLGAATRVPECANAGCAPLGCTAQPADSTMPTRIPATAITIAVEDWQQAALPTTSSETRCGIVVAGDVAGTLGQRLTDAVAAHGGCDVVPPNEADIVAVVAPALDQIDLTAAIEQIAGRPDVGLPDYAAIIGPRCRAVWLITVGGERVQPDDADARPAQAALAAMHRSVGFEFPDQTFGSVDLSSRDVDGPTGEGHRRRALLGDATVTAASAWPTLDATSGSFRECRNSAGSQPLDAATLENVVITGGSGAIGLRYAQLCVEHGARKVILLSRNGVDPAVLNRLTEGHSAKVHAPACDITDRVALSAITAGYADSGFRRC